MNLDEARVKIDEIDAKMKPLFLARMECAEHVAEAKAAVGSESVFVLERELAVIEKRTADVDASVRDEYTAFLRHLMSVSRRYQYGILTGLQDKVIKTELERAGLDENTAHAQVRIAFACGKERSGLNLFLNMAELNQIPVDEMKLAVQDGKQRIEMILDGNIKDAGMRRFLCQTAKESEEFQILGLI